MTKFYEDIFEKQCKKSILINNTVFRVFFDNNILGIKPKRQTIIKFVKTSYKKWKFEFEFVQNSLRERWNKRDIEITTFHGDVDWRCYVLSFWSFEVFNWILERAMNVVMKIIISNFLYTKTHVTEANVIWKLMTNYPNQRQRTESIHSALFIYR